MLDYNERLYMTYLSSISSYSPEDLVVEHKDNLPFLTAVALGAVDGDRDEPIKTKSELVERVNFLLSDKCEGED